MSRDQRNAALPWLAVVAISVAAFGLALLGAWWADYPGAKAERWHLLNVLAIEYQLEQAAGPSDIAPILINNERKFPPLLYLAAVLARRISPIDDDRLSCLCAMLLFSLAMHCGFFLLLRQRLSAWLAVLGTLMLAGNHVLLSHLQVFNMAYPSAATAVLALGLLARLDVFLRMRDTLIFGAVCALGALLYYTVPIYVAPAVLFVLIARLRRTRTDRGRIAAQFGIFLLIGLALAGPYYFSESFLSWGDQRLERFQEYEGPVGAQMSSAGAMFFYWLGRYILQIVGALWITPLALLLLIIGR
ncbi:MAG: glycosyltransferase family 39 protein, partial [Candidatus Alcyoniella australis]|nr:glycosyltransferase family 39 protein [Candidatus Alcyoniella australis]